MQLGEQLGTVEQQLQMRDDAAATAAWQTWQLPQQLAAAGTCH